MCVARMNRCDTRVAFEVRWIVGKDSVDSVDLHPGDEPRVMNLNALHCILDDELSPFGIDSRGIVQERENWIETGKAALRLLG